MSVVLLRGMKILSSVRLFDFGRNIAFPVRFNSFVIFFTKSRLPSICASPICFGMVLSVIMRIMNTPMSSEAKPSFRKRGLGLKSNIMPVIMSSDPTIFALMCGWCIEMCCFNF